MKDRDIEVLVLNKTEIESLVDEKDAAEAALEAFRALGVNDLRQEHLVQKTIGDNIINTMPGYFISKNIFGTKQASVMYKRAPGDTLPRVWGAYIVLTDPVNALPYAFMDGTAITNMRTAGGHAVVGALYLARKNSAKLAIIGCGAEARTGFRSLMNHFPLEEVRLYDIKQEVMDAFIREMADQYTLKFLPMESIRAAVKGADLVWMVTSAPRSILLEERWVEPGCFVAGLSAFRDIDPSLSEKADKWVVGSLEQDGHIMDRKPPMYPDGLSRDHIYADMGEIVNGFKPGRENENERIVYTHMGMAGHDILLARTAYERAVKKGVGVKIVL